MPRWLMLFVMVCGAFGGEIQPVVAGDVGWRAFADLAAHYRDPKVPLAVDAALDDAFAGVAGNEAEAVAYLLALLRQSLADETNGRMYYRTRPTWQEGGTSAARSARFALAQKLSARAASVAALPLAAWLMDEDWEAANHLAGVAILRRVTGPAAIPLIRCELAGPHHHQGVVVALIEECARRKLVELAPDILRLTTSYRAAIRTAARTAAGAVGITAMPTYQAETAFTPWLEGELARIASLQEAPPASDAVFHRFVITREEDGKRRQIGHQYEGWLAPAGEHAGMFHDGNLRERDYPLLDPAKPVPTRTGYSIDYATPEPFSLVAGAARYLSARTTASSEEDFRKLINVGFSYDNSAPFTTMPEVMIAVWAWQRGDRATCAKLLFPRLDAAADERWIGWFARDQAGRVHHEEMLEAFSRRDLRRALILARHVSQSQFNGYEYQERAIKLAGELAERLGDFTTFVLPTAKEWKQQQATLTRLDQVRFLADRLRLLNCIQYSQPGGVDYRTYQERFPRRAEANQPVINPYIELFRLRLTVAELPTLIPYLADEQFMPTFSYWRNFSPHRVLHQVNWAVATVINSVAMRELADLRAFTVADGAGRTAHLDRLLVWCRDHANDTQEQLALAALTDATDGDSVQLAAQAAVSARIVSALPLILRRSKEFKGLGLLAAPCAYRLGGAAAVEAAPSWFMGTNERLQLFGAAILFRHAPAEHPQRAAAEQHLVTVFAQDQRLGFLGEIADDLLASKRADARRLLCVPLEQPWFIADRWTTGPLLRHLVLAGNPVAIAHVRDGLARTAAAPETDTVDGVWEGAEVKRVPCIGDLYATVVATWSPATPVVEALAPDAVRASQRARVAQWFSEQAALIVAGQPQALSAASPAFDGFSEWINEKGE